MLPRIGPHTGIVDGPCETQTLDIPENLRPGVFWSSSVADRALEVGPVRPLLRQAQDLMPIMKYGDSPPAHSGSESW